MSIGFVELYCKIIVLWWALKIMWFISYLLCICQNAYKGVFIISDGYILSVISTLVQRCVGELAYS